MEGEYIPDRYFCVSFHQGIERYAQVGYEDNQEGAGKKNTALACCHGWNLAYKIKEQVNRRDEWASYIGHYDGCNS